MTPELEEALYVLYKGQTNVAVKAKELDMPLADLKRVLTAFIKANPADETAWNRDLELSWPYQT